jgi:hypothetical protein
VRGGEKVCEKRGRERMWVRERKRGGEREERVVVQARKS